MMMVRGTDFSPKMTRVQLVDRIGSDSNTPGTIHITTSHVVFRADEGMKEIWIANALIGSVERSQLTNSGVRLIIKCKHFQTLILLVNKDCSEIYEALVTCSRIYNINDAFAFVYKPGENKNIENWSRLDWDKEFKRQKLSDAWTEFDFNNNYVHCDTYPDKLWFPSSANKQILLGSVKFRSRGRLPVLSYFHHKSNAAICRCAQPLSGFSARCVEDEQLIDHIRRATPGLSTVFVVDTRPKINAMANKVQGKGFEDSRYYSNMQLHSFDIENIHVMRNSQTKLLDACQKQSTLTEFFKAVDSSGWLRHLKALFDCGKFIADSVDTGISCIVHCSDGWDRTAQTISIAQILLDPYYHTLEGFEVLIDKEWLGFGFKFDDRCGRIFYPNDENSKEVSPIFTQFIDVVYQIMRVEPTTFEFNERFLLELNEHAYSCIYGNFIGNCEKDRKDLRVLSRTRSFWTAVDTQLVSYKNPFYKPGNFNLRTIDMSHSVFVPWITLYNRFDSGIQCREYFSDIPLSMKEHIDVMEKALKGEGSSHDIALQWQSLLGCEECSSESCKREFTRFERRPHCFSCGLVYCPRCINIKAENRLCTGCLSKTSSTLS